MRYSFKDAGDVAEVFNNVHRDDLIIDAVNALLTVKILNEYKPIIVNYAENLERVLGPDYDCPVDPNSIDSIISFLIGDKTNYRIARGVIQDEKLRLEDEMRRNISNNPHVPGLIDETIEMYDNIDILIAFAHDDTQRYRDEAAMSLNGDTE